MPISFCLSPPFLSNRRANEYKLQIFTVKLHRRRCGSKGGMDGTLRPLTSLELSDRPKSVPVLLSYSQAENSHKLFFGRALYIF